MMEERARRAAELAARASYGRLVAILASRTGDIADAEDALADALEAALRRWPEQGAPDNPEAWLVTAARNADANRRRHARMRDRTRPELERVALELAPDGNPRLDARLNLLFVCAHPAIDASVRAPLMLQTVLGLDATRIAQAFLVSAAAMAQKLVRAKSKIRAAGLRFEAPDPERLPERLPDVLDAIYAAYGAGWDEIGGDPHVRGLTEEALFLARLIVELSPEQPEAMGLLSLMLHCEARRPARRDAAGAFVPLPLQDARLWSRDMIAEAERWLTRAARHASLGRYQCEAAIQSVHAQRPIIGRLNHDALLTLYDLLARHAPSLGALVGRAAVLLDAGRADDALAALDSLPAERIVAYQPYWVARARALEARGAPEANAALQRAIELTGDASVRAYLRGAKAS